MAPLTKDTLEAANIATEAAVSKTGAPTKSAQGGGHLRADAVSLEIPVKVHGSKVTEVVREVTPHTEPFEEQTSTMIVFPQGGVVRMSTSVNVGQMLVVTNLKSRQDAICRVVKVRTFSNLQGYVEVEFTHPQPGYWGVYFPSDGPARANKTAPPVPAVTVEPSAKEKPAAPVSAVPEISWAPAVPANPVPQPLADANSFATNSKPVAVPPAPAALPSKPETTFISIGSQEKVQPAASATVTTKPVAPVKTQTESAKEPAPELPKPISVFSFPSTPRASAPSSLSMDELRGDASADSSASLETSSADLDSAAAEEESHVASAPRTESTRGAFGSFSGGASLGTSHSAAPELFAAPSESGAETSTEHTAPRQNGILIGVCLLVLFGGVAGGVFYFRHAVNGGAAKSNPAVVSQPATVASASEPAAATSAPPVSRSKANPAAINAAGAATPAPNAGTPGTPATADGNTSSPSATTQPAAPAKRSAPSVTSLMMDGTLAGHPVSSQRAADGDADSAPSLDPSAPSPAADSALPGIMSSSNVEAPPEPDIRPEGPVVVGGSVKEPRLVYSVLPVYPLVAKEANVQGDVVVKTTIDKDGHVTHMEVVSGPTMLRQPALDALKRWKYEPSKLNGEAIAVQMLVTLKFHH